MTEAIGTTSHAGDDAVTLRAVDPSDPADVAALSDLAVTTFLDTFAEHNTPEDTQAFIDEYLDARVLVGRLERSGHIAVVAETAGGLAGYYYVIRDSPNDLVDAGSPIELSKLYVDSTAHRRGLGTQMMKDILAKSREWGHDRLWLSVWEHNHRAKAFYRNYPFVCAGTWEYPVGAKIDIDEVWIIDLGAPDQVTAGSDGRVEQT